MIQVKDGKVVQTNLPINGRLSDGRTVSGYYKLPEDILKAEGWLPEEEVKPEYDPETERLVFDHYEILKGKVEKVYRVEPIPESTAEIEYDPIAELEKRIAKLESDVSSLKAENLSK